MIPRISYFHNERLVIGWLRLTAIVLVMLSPVNGVPLKPANPSVPLPTTTDTGGAVNAFPTLDPPHGDGEGSESPGGLSLQVKLSDDGTESIHTLTWTSNPGDNFDHVDLATRRSDGNWSSGETLTPAEIIAKKKEIRVPADQFHRYHYRLIPFADRGEGIKALPGSNIERTTVVPENKTLVEEKRDDLNVEFVAYGWLPFDKTDGEGHTIDQDPEKMDKLYLKMVHEINNWGNYSYVWEETEIIDLHLGGSDFKQRSDISEEKYKYIWREPDAFEEVDLDGDEIELNQLSDEDLSHSTTEEYFNYTIKYWDGSILTETGSGFWETNGGILTGGGHFSVTGLGDFPYDYPGVDLQTGTSSSWINESEATRRFYSRTDSGVGDGEYHYEESTLLQDELTKEMVKDKSASAMNKLERPDNDEASFTKFPLTGFDGALRLATYYFAEDAELVESGWGGRGEMWCRVAGSKLTIRAGAVEELGEDPPAGPHDGKLVYAAAQMESKTGKTGNRKDIIAKTVYGKINGEVAIEGPAKGYSQYTASARESWSELQISDNRGTLHPSEQDKTTVYYEGDGVGDEATPYDYRGAVLYAPVDGTGGTRGGVGFSTFMFASEDQPGKITLSWSGSAVDVFDSSRAGTDGRPYRLSSPLVVDVTKTGWTSRSLEIVPREGAAGTVSVVLKAVDGAKTPHEEKSATFTVVEDEPSDESSPIDSMEVPINDATGPRYRKIALNGRPLADEAPQTEDESDQEKEQSYVDAFDLSFNHNTSDVYIQIPGSELSLEVTRTVQSEVWSSHSGLRPHERPDLPFGAGWSSNLVSYIERSETSGPNPDGIKEPVEVRVVDHQGRSYKFIEHYEGANRKYTPMPTSHIEARFYLTELEYDPVALEYVFRENHGTTLRFKELVAEVISVQADRVNGGSSANNSAYSRLTRVTDRLGYSLHYEYLGTHTLIPRKIYASSSVVDSAGVVNPGNYVLIPNKAIYIRQENHRVTRVWDPKGTQITYSYEVDTFVHPFVTNLTQRIPLLTAVNRPGLAPVLYGYESGGANSARRRVEVDPVPRKDPEDVRNYFHVNLASISQVIEGNQKSTTLIDRDWDSTKFRYVKNEIFSGYVRQSGLARRVVRIAGPWGASSFQGKGYEKIAGGPAAGANSSRAQKYEGTRSTAVTDAAGLTTRYRFEDVRMETLWFYKDYVDSSKAYKNPRLLYYLKMVIELPTGDEEEFNFDLSAGLALGSVVDFSGNRTTYAYGDLWTPPAGSLFNRSGHIVDLGGGKLLNIGTSYPVSGFHRHGEPTSVVADGNRKTEYTYHGKFRLLATSTSYLNTNKTQKTIYGLNTNNGRTQSILVQDSGSTKTTTNLSYGFLSKPGFVTRKVIVGNSVASEASIVSDFVPDDNGRVFLEVSYPNGAPASGPADGSSWTTPAGAAWVENTYDHNNNKVFVKKSAGFNESGTFQEEVHGFTTSSQLFAYSTANQLTRVTHDNDTFKQFGYDLRGNKIIETDERGYATNLYYDLAGRFYKSSRHVFPGTEITTTHVLNSVGSIVATTDPRGYTTGFGYDKLHRLVATNVPGVGLTTFQYGANCGGSIFNHSGFKPTLSIDPRGFKTRVVYDDQYRPVETAVEYEPGLYGVTKNAYDWVGNVLQTTDPSGMVTSTIFDGLSRPTQVTASGRSGGTDIVKDTFYTSTGLPWKTITSAGSVVVARVALTYYDGMGRPMEVVTPLVPSGYNIATSPSVKTFYDRAGNVGRTVTRVNDTGVTQTYEFAYDSLGRKTHTRAPLVPVLTGETVTSEKPVTHVEYDAVGNVWKSWDAYENLTINSHDEANRLTSTALPAVEVLDDSSAGTPVIVLPVSSMTYDPGGNVLTATDALGNTVTNTYDAASRLSSTRDAENITVRYEYDPAGNRTRVIDGNGHQTVMRYDGYNRLTRQQDHLGRTRTSGYNAVSLLKREDELGRETNYRYDPHNRLWKTIYQSGGTGGGHLTRTNGYDDFGQLLDVVETGGANGTACDVAHTYDTLGRALTETSNGVTHAYQYDFIGNVTQITYGHTGRVITSKYDALNRLTEMNEGGRFTRYFYDKNGNKKKIEFAATQAGAAHTTQKWTYDALNRVKTMTSVAGTTPDVCGTTSHWDAAGNLRRTVESYANIPGRVVNLAYDNLYRLTGETVKAEEDPTNIQNTVFEHDDASNVTRRQVTMGSNLPHDRRFNYNALNQLISYHDADPAITTQVTLKYDLAGNRVSRTRAGKLTSYLYDFENRLIAVNDAGATAAKTINLYPGVDAPAASATPAAAIHYHLGAANTSRYAYDYRTRRVRKTENAVTTNLVFSAGLSVQEFTGETIPAGDPQVEYIRGSSMGGGIGGLLYSKRGSDVRWNHFNGRGDLIGQTSSTGNIEYQAAYMAYGDRSVESGSSDDPQRANTKDEDPTGLLNEGMRYRDIASGVFLTRDPAGFVDGPNLYAYVRQNPWTSFDPLGLQSEFRDVKTPENVEQYKSAVSSYNRAQRANMEESARLGAEKVKLQVLHETGKISASDFKYGMNQWNAKHDEFHASQQNFDIEMSYQKAAINHYLANADESGNLSSDKATLRTTDLYNMGPGYRTSPTIDPIDIASGAIAYKSILGSFGRSVIAKGGAGFADDARLLSHFEKHGAEFGVKNADEYLQVGQYIMQQGHKVQYLYKGETRTGFTQFMGNSRSGSSKFGFVGTNADGAITTIHTQSGNSFWKLLNGNAADKTIRPVP